MSRAVVSGVAAAVQRHVEGLKTTPFAAIEEVWGLENNFHDGFAAARQHDSLFMSVRKLAARPSPSLGDVRFFLYCVLHVGPGFTGDGWLYDGMGSCIGEEWFAQNVPLRYGDDCYVAHIPARVVLAATGVQPDASASGGSVVVEAGRGRHAGGVGPAFPAASTSLAHRMDGTVGGVARVTSFGSDGGFQSAADRGQRDDGGEGGMGTGSGSGSGGGGGGSGSSSSSSSSSGGSHTGASAWVPVGITAVAAVVVAFALRKR